MSKEIMSKKRVREIRFQTIIEIIMILIMNLFQEMTLIRSRPR